ncbi:MAG: hypothetical protein LIO53_02925 [Oscillospiraceae bacterium]|nr:hypothetical protein [Oscillospiraceae bacterium]
MDELSGTGEPIVVQGKWQYKEQVESAHVVGTYVSESGEETKSKKATIVYSKTGSHVYPRKEIPDES